jgi:polar amino acid transport system substrate-binding protein
VTPAWTQVISGGWDDRWDVNIGSMVITRERMKALYFTQPYITGAAVLFVHKDNRSYAQPADLAGKRIGVCAGCAYESYLKGTLDIPGESMVSPLKDAAVVAYDTDTSALKDLAIGDGVHLDAVLTDPDTGQTAINDGLPLKQLGDPLYHDFDAIAIDKKSSKDPKSLVERITAIIQQMHQDGTLLKLSRQFYHGDFTTLASQYDINGLYQFIVPAGTQ